MLDDTMVNVSKVVKSYNGMPQSIRACDNVSLAVSKGEIVAMTGPSGSGKSTLLHLIGGLDNADSGEIVVDNTVVTDLKRRSLVEYRRRVGFVFQRFHLLPMLTATDNVIAPVMPVRVDFDKREKARKLLEAVGMVGREDAFPGSLSGGEQQRVAIARALIGDPPVVLADEPTGNLDSNTGQKIMDLLTSVRDRFGTTMIIATHDSAIATLCDRIVEIRDGAMG